MKAISKLLRVAVVVAIGFIAIGASMNEAGARGKTEGKDADAGLTASSYRKPIKLNGVGSPGRRGSRLTKESGGMAPNNGGLKSAPVQ